MIKEITLRKMEEVIRVLNELPNNYIFRGHANSTWKLQSTVERMSGKKFGTDFVHKYADYCIKIFKSKFHLCDNQNLRPESKLEWLSLMQHYGVPTRLLDFTTSPFIALYFAIEAYDPSSTEHLAIYAIDYSALMDVSLSELKKVDTQFKETRQSINDKQDEVFETSVDRFSCDILWVTEPARLNVRVDRQSGCFLLSGNKDKGIEHIISMDQYNEITANKYIIDRALYEGAFGLLRKMNLSPKVIYGDLSGLAKTLSLEFKIYAM